MSNTNTNEVADHIANVEAGVVYYGHNKTTVAKGFFLTEAGKASKWYIRSEKTQRIVARLNLVAFV